MIEEKDTILGETRLEKSPIGITGFDNITDDGLQKDCTTIVYGSAGSERTLMAMKFLVKGPNSIFTGDKLLTTPNPGTSEDHRLMAALGLKTHAPDNKCDEGCLHEKIHA